MSKMQEKKNVLSQLLSTIDEVALKKTSNRMMIAAKIGNALKDKGISQKLSVMPTKVRLLQMKSLSLVIRTSKQL